MGYLGSLGKSWGLIVAQKLGHGLRPLLCPSCQWFASWRHLPWHHLKFDSCDWHGLSKQQEYRCDVMSILLCALNVLVDFDLCLLKNFAAFHGGFFRGVICWAWGPDFHSKTAELQGLTKSLIKCRRRTASKNVVQYVWEWGSWGNGWCVAIRINEWKIPLGVYK